MQNGQCNTPTGTGLMPGAPVCYMPRIEHGFRPMSVPWRALAADLLVAEQSAYADVRGVRVAGTEADRDSLGN